MKVSLVAAVANNGVIGRGNELPWRLRADLKAFKARTLGRHIIVGRKTFESFGGKPLPGRPNIIVTRDPSYTAPGCSLARSPLEALERAEKAGESEAMVIGGAQVYQDTLHIADIFYRTRVLADVAGDVFFPAFDESLWELQSATPHAVDEYNDLPFVIEVLTRRVQ